MAETQKIISPVDGSVYAERPLADAAQVAAVLAKGKQAQGAWREISVADRAKLLTAFTDHVVANRDAISEELTWQMGRPVGQTPFEVGGFEERARHMIAIAEASLQDVAVDDKPGFTRFIRREPLGLVLAIAAWNYPYLISVNAVVPALLAGNTVVLKQSSQTLLCAERYADAAAAAGLPDGVFQVLHMDHAATERAIQDPAVDFVAFTGSVEGGAAIQRAASTRFIATGLELGGKDPAYVRADANLDFAVENLVDGAFFNSGQSCCGIERIYVHQDLYDAFVDGFVDLAKGYRLGNPLEADTNLGPMVRTSAAQFVRGQVAAAVAAGARALVDESGFPASKPDTPYLAPQVLVDVDHTMSVMADESFGPVIGIMKVANDAEAVAMMNDSRFGLTASIWTEDEDAALAIGDQVATGTWFMNRCDYLDPALAWVGVKDSGRGCTLSSVGYEHLTRPKSFHLRTGT